MASPGHSAYPIRVTAEVVKVGYSGRISVSMPNAQYQQKIFSLLLFNRGLKK